MDYCGVLRQRKDIADSNRTFDILASFDPLYWNKTLYQRTTISSSRTIRLRPIVSGSTPGK